MKKGITTIFILLTLNGLLIAGGSAEDGEMDTQKMVTDMSWEEITAQAKEEGKVVWYHWYLQDSFREIVKDFEQKYGIEVIIPDGSNDGNTKKLLAERNRETGDIDVLSTGGDYTEQIDMPQMYLGPLTKILPEGDLLRTAINGGESDGYAVAFWGNQTGIAFDPLKISEAELPQTVKEVEDWMEKNPRKFGFNYENGGSGPAFIESVSRNLLKGVDFTSGEESEEKIQNLSPAWQWFKSRENLFVITGGNADSLTRLSDGEFVLVPAWEDHLAGLQKKNEIDDRIQFYIPEFGMPGGGNIVGIPANAPHPAAGILLISWITAAETQTKFNADLGSAPQHPGADSSKALVPMDQRAYSTNWASLPFGTAFLNEFINNVILE